MDIKYDKSGQPLPFEEQKFDEVKPIAQEEEISDIQLANPFVQEYIKNQQPSAAKPQESAKEPEQTEPDSDDENSEESLEEVVAPKKQDHPNFRALRESHERVERERDLALRRLQEYESSMQRQPAQRDDDDDDLAEDGFVEPKHIKKTRQELKKVQKELAETRQKITRDMQEVMLYKQYPDIDHVVSTDNLSLLKDLKPHYARQCKELYDRGDIYSAGELAYHYMKDLGIHKSAQKSDYLSERARVDKNLAKPKLAANAKTTTQQSPLAKAQQLSADLSDEDMKRHYREMQEAIRNRG